MFYLYLPIKLANSNKLVVSDRLKIFMPLINKVVSEMKSKGIYYESYLYITAKHLFITPTYLGNRPGYHSDGFMTKDINYVWCDCNPTIFNSTKFNLTQDDVLSLQEMEDQALPKNEVTYPNYSFLRLNEFNIHKVAPNTQVRMRTFLKLSVSKDKYDLVGNSHNYGLRYDWEMKERGEVRNIPQSK